METLKKNDFEGRMVDGQGNTFTTSKMIDDATMKDLVKESEFNWNKAAEFTRYETEAPPIIMDNVLESETISTNQTRAIWIFA